MIDREVLDLKLANQLLYFLKVAKESGDYLIVSSPCILNISDVFSFDMNKLVDFQDNTTYEMSLYSEQKKIHTYLIRVTFGVDFVRVELRQYKRDRGVYVELYSAKCDLVAPSLTTLKALVSNIRTTSAVSLFSEGLRQLGFSEQLER